MNSRQLARFSIAESLIREKPEEVAEILALLKAVPVRAECLYHKQTVEYIAISDKFRFIEPMYEPPEVEIEVTRVEGKIASVEVLYPEPNRKQLGD